MVIRRHKKILITWVLIVAIFLLTGVCTASVGTSIRLQYPKFSLKLRLEHTPIIPTAQVAPTVVLKDSSKESKSWVPRIVIPLAVVAITATATYLIFSQRGG